VSKSPYIHDGTPAEVSTVTALGIDWTVGHETESDEDDHGRITHRRYPHVVKIGRVWAYAIEVLSQAALDAIELELNVPEAEEC